MFTSGFRHLHLTSYVPDFAYFTQPGLAHNVPQPDFYAAQGGFIDCEIINFINFHHEFHRWHDLVGGPEFPGMSVGNIKDAMDAILAEHPEVTHFTLEPQGNIATLPGIALCGDVIVITPGGEWQPPYAGAPAGTDTHHWFPKDYVSERWWDLDGVQQEVAIQYPGRNLEPEFGFPGDWFLGDGENAGNFQYPDDPGNFIYTGDPTRGFVTVGASAGLYTYILRPTALTWADQDPTNEANRIFWEYDDIDTGDMTLNAPCRAGRVYINTVDGFSFSGASDYVEVKGWAIVPIAEAPESPPGTIFAGPGISGRLQTESNKVLGRDVNAVVGFF